MSDFITTIQDENNNKHIQQIQKAIQNDDLVIWLGGGMSVESGVPQISEILRKALKHLPNESQSKAEELLKFHQLEELFYFIEQQAPQAILQEIRIANDNLDSTEKIDGAIKHIPKLNACRYISFSVDGILEELLLKDQKELARIDFQTPKYRQWVLSRKNFLFYFYGKFSQKSDFIYSLSSLYNLYSKKETQTLLREIIENKTILFLGTNLINSPLYFTYHEVMEEIRKGNNQNEINSLTVVARSNNEKINNSIEASLAKIGTKPIWLHNDSKLDVSEVYRDQLSNLLLKISYCNYTTEANSFALREALISKFLRRKKIDKLPGYTHSALELKRDSLLFDETTGIKVHGRLTIGGKIFLIETYELGRIKKAQGTDKEPQKNNAIKSIVNRVKNVHEILSAQEGEYTYLIILFESCLEYFNFEHYRSFLKKDGLRDEQTMKLELELKHQLAPYIQNGFVILPRMEKIFQRNLIISGKK